MIDVVETLLPGVVLLRPKIHSDSRGCFRELYHRRRYQELGFRESFAQSNCSVSQEGVLRGLHFQRKNPQTKLVSVLDGLIWDVAVDIRPDSKTYRQWFGTELSSENGAQLYVPGCYAHGFVALSRAIVHYQCDALYDPTDEAGVAWNDPELGVAWPVVNPKLSEKDSSLPTLRQAIGQ